MQKIFKNTLVLLLFAYFSGFYLSTAIFTHKHLVCGQYVVHSHPYNPISEKNGNRHEHSIEEFLFIFTIAQNLSFYELLTGIKIEVKDFIYCYTDFIEKGYTFIEHLIADNSLRAPPIVLY